MTTRMTARALPGATSAADRVRRWRPRLPRWMPTGVLGRIRWLFLSFTLVNILGMLPLLIWGSTAPTGLRGAAVLACLVLTGLWVRGYRRSRFPVGGVPLEFAALLLLTVAVADPAQALGVLFAGANFRAIFGSKRDLGAMVLAYALAYLVGQLVADGPRFVSGLGT